jgi:hypothetical protein
MLIPQNIWRKDKVVLLMFGAPLAFIFIYRTSKDTMQGKIYLRPYFV